MIYWLALIIAGLLLLIVLRQEEKKESPFLQSLNKTVQLDSMIAPDQQAINLNRLSAETWRKQIRQTWRMLRRQVGAPFEIKLIIFTIGLVFAGHLFNQEFLQASTEGVITIFVVGGWFLGFQWLQSRERKQFEESFPDALNMLSSAVSAGESIMHAIIFVGKSLDSEVGREFRSMGERLKVGESPDSVFVRSCERFPYPSFHFFVITLRANMQRGGQLKDVINRLNRLMFNSRAIEKKKFALTSEARTSVKIVAAIPFLFLLMMKFLSPENYAFVMFEEAGRPILYYVLASESIGIFIVWMLMRGAR